MALPPIAICICVTPSYSHWLERKINAITTARTQTYNPHDVKVLKFDDSTRVCEMFQKALRVVDAEGYPYYAIIGADDWLDHRYIERCMDALLRNPSLAAASTAAILVSRDDEPIGFDGHWVAGVWRTLVASTLGGYLKPVGREWGCAADLWARARFLGYSTLIAPERYYYWRIYSGSVSKQDPDIDAKIRNRKHGEIFALGGNPRD